MLPWVPGAVRAVLLGDPEFAAMCGGQVSSRAPADVSRPYVTVTIPGTVGYLGGGGHSLLAQVSGWAPQGTRDPEPLVWDIGVAAGRLLDTARNVPYQGMHWSGRWVDGPMPLVDVSRGPSVPLYYAPVRVEITAHAR